MISYAYAAIICTHCHITADAKADSFQFIIMVCLMRTLAYSSCPKYLHVRLILLRVTRIRLGPRLSCFLFTDIW
jgi:hypothetical protein